MIPLPKRIFSEFLGTFAMVFAGTGAIVIDQISGGAITHVGVALTFGLIILAMIYTFGEISGAHFNPAVTLGFFAARRFEARDVPPYIAAQLAGAFAASGTLGFLFPHSPTLGATVPSGSALQSFVLETILTFFLMLVILSVSTGSKEKGITAGLVVGSVIALEAMFAGPISGASMNPARSIAPAVVSGQLAHLWVFIAGPVLGALLAIPACCGVREAGCCAISETPSTHP
jgi:aquaporin Z